MDLLSLMGVFNYGLVLIYGLFLSANIAGGWKTKQQKQMIFLLLPMLLLVQSICWLSWGVETVRRLYPLIVHLPLILMLRFVLNKPTGIALTSVFTAYLCCQLPRWIKLVAVALSGSELAGELAYTVSIFPIYFLLRRFFTAIAYDAMSYSNQSLILFASLPTAYYIYDYATVVYSDALYREIPALVELFPTMSIIFYVAFIAAYHFQTQHRNQAELQRSMLESELKQSETEMESLRREETQAAVYKHDMRHHLTAIEGYLSTGKPEQAEEYIKKVQADVDAISHKRFCENEIVNLLCSSFDSRAERLGVELATNVRLPAALSVSDTELCSVISNGLENALNACSQVVGQKKQISFYCEKKLNKLLIEICNPYAGQVVIHDGIPVTDQPNHGYGCHSIRTIAERLGGLCSFEAESGLFTLRVILPENGDL